MVVQATSAVFKLGRGLQLHSKGLGSVLMIRSTQISYATNQNEWTLAARLLFEFLQVNCIFY